VIQFSQNRPRSQRRRETSQRRTRAEDPCSLKELSTIQQSTCGCAAIRKPLVTRNDSNAIAAVLESGCVERPDDACAIY
jgi:hypothetical protein